MSQTSNLNGRKGDFLIGQYILITIGKLAPQYWLQSIYGTTVARVCVSHFKCQSTKDFKWTFGGTFFSGAFNNKVKLNTYLGSY